MVVPDNNLLKKIRRDADLDEEQHDGEYAWPMRCFRGSKRRGIPGRKAADVCMVEGY